MLDEPTNDLDMETLDLLQELVAGFPGTVILVSHDRDFLDRTVTSTVAPEGEGLWVEYAGGYSDMLAQRGGRHLGDAVKARPSPPKPVAKTQPASASDGPAASRRKLSYKQKFALETLPRKMEAASAAIVKLEARLGDPELYSRDPDAFAKTAAHLDAERTALAAMEEEWLELELLREELEAG